MIERLRRFGFYGHSAEFDAPQKDDKQSAEIQKAINDNDVEKVYGLLGSPALRMLLALSGRDDKLTLGRYHNRTAKKKIIKLGLATYEDNYFRITVLGLKVVQEQVKQRLKSMDHRQ